MQDQIIFALKKSDGYLSGEDLSEELDTSRAAVWKNIQELRKEGYDIVAVPHLGYKLVSCPDKLLPREIQFGLSTQILGKKIICYDSLSSTMDVAFQLGMQEAKEGTVVVSESQTKGRGRLGRSWVSPKGKGVYMSIILRPDLFPSSVAQLTLLSAIALCEAVQRVSGLQPQIKWPNDLLIDNKKLAGILTELSAEMDRIRFVVVGIGVNVNTAPTMLPSHATSLKAQTNQTISRIQLIQEILLRMEEWYTQLKSKGFAPVQERWKKLSLTLGKRIRIHDSYGDIEGQAVDLDKDGGLIIREDSGILVKRMSGDVVQVR